MCHSKRCKHTFYFKNLASWIYASSFLNYTYPDQICYFVRSNLFFVIPRFVQKGREGAPDSMHQTAVLAYSSALDSYRPLYC